MANQEIAHLCKVLSENFEKQQQNLKAQIDRIHDTIIETNTLQARIEERLKAVEHHVTSYQCSYKDTIHELKAESKEKQRNKFKVIMSLIGITLGLLALGGTSVWNMATLSHTVENNTKIIQQHSKILQHKD